MLAPNACGVGAVLDSDDASLDRLQPDPPSKTSSTAEPIGRSPGMFTPAFLLCAVITCDLRTGWILPAAYFNFYFKFEVIPIMIRCMADGGGFEPPETITPLIAWDVHEFPLYRATLMLLTLQSFYFKFYFKSGLDSSTSEFEVLVLLHQYPRTRTTPAHDQANGPAQSV